MLAVHTVQEGFSVAECDQLLAQIADAPLRDAGLVGQKRDPAMRRADLVWLDEVAGCDWVMDRAVDLVRAATRALFDFDITDFLESPQVARYDATREGQLAWHSDIGAGQLAARRKLTIVIQLDPSSAYEGGDLEIWPDNRVVAADRAQGAAVLFPSFMLHRVRPVTAGVRRSLTLWCHGPAFR